MQKETFTTVLTTASALTVEFAREFVLDQMLDAISYDLEFDNQCGIHVAITVCEEMSWQHSLGGYMNRASNLRLKFCSGILELGLSCPGNQTGASS